MEPLRRYVIFHTGGDYGHAAETRSAEIRRAMADLGKVEGVDFKVEVHRVTRAAQVSNALRFGDRKRRAGPLAPPAASVDFFSHSGSRAIFLDTGSTGAGTNLALGSSVELSPGTWHSATPFRKVLTNVRPWGEVNVHGCRFGRGEGGQKSGARQLADAVDVIVRAYPDPGGTIFTQDPALAFGRRTSRAADRNKVPAVTDPTKPVWMVPLRENAATHRRTFVPRSITQWIEGRGPSLAAATQAIGRSAIGRSMSQVFKPFTAQTRPDFGRSVPPSHVPARPQSASPLQQSHAHFTALTRPDARVSRPREMQVPKQTPVLQQTRTDWFTAQTRPDFGRSIRTFDRPVKPQGTSSALQSRPDWFTAQSRPDFSRSILKPPAPTGTQPASFLRQSKPNWFTAQTRPEFGRSIQSAYTPTHPQADPVLHRSEPDWFTSHTRPVLRQSIPKPFVARARQVAPVLQQSRPDWFTAQTRPNFGQSRGGVP